MVAFFQQFFAFAVVAGSGYFLRKKGILSEQSTEDLSRLLMQFIFPLLVIQSFFRPWEREEAFSIIVIFLFTALIQTVYLLLSGLLLGKHRPVDRYAVIFNNKGFIGIPVVSALFGAGATFFLMPQIVISNVFTILYGVPLLTEGKKQAKFSIGSFLRTPIVFSFLLGLLLYFARLPVPQPVVSVLDMLTSLNTPLAMLLLGAFIAEKPLRGFFSVPQAWWTSAVRLLIFPLVALLFIKFLPFGSEEMKLVTAVAWACPTAMNLGMQSKIYHQDTFYASQIIVITSIFCVVTIPVILSIAKILL